MRYHPTLSLYLDLRSTKNHGPNSHNNSHGNGHGSSNPPTVPDDVVSFWKQLDPAVKAALISKASKDAICPLETTATGASSSDKNKGGGLQGRRANAASGPRIESGTLIGGSSFVQREASPGWLKVRNDVYESVKERRDEELSKKVPVDIEVTLPDGNTLTEDKVRVDIRFLIELIEN